MAITGPIIPAKSQVPGAVPSITTTIANSLVDTPSTEVDRAVQVGEIISNVADGKLWLKKADQTFAPLTRSKTLAIWTANSTTNATTPVINSFSVFGPRGGLTDANLLADMANIEVGTGNFSVLTFTEGGANNKSAFFHGIIPEGTTWSGLNLILKFALASGTGNVEWAVSMQKPTGITDTTFTTESFKSSPGSSSWSTSVNPIIVPTGLTEGDFYRIKLRRLASTNDTSTATVYLLSAELRAV